MKDQADHALVRLICGLDLPLQMTARQEFTEFVKAVQKAPKSYVTPKPTKLHGLIKKRDEEIQADIKDIMCTALGCSIALDSSTTLGTKAFLSIVVTGVSSSFDPFTKSFAVTGFDTDHTADNIEKTLNSKLEGYLPQTLKFTAITTDGGSNMRAYARNASKPWIYCMVHNLQRSLVSITSDEVCQEVFKKVRRICKLFRRSTTAAQSLKSVQESCEQPAKVLFVDVPTRFDSWGLVIGRFLELQKYIDQAFVELKHKKGFEKTYIMISKFFLDQDEITLLIRLNAVLTIVANHTPALSRQTLLLSEAALLITTMRMELDEFDKKSQSFGIRIVCQDP
jgi:hypothetical protein